MNDDLVTYLIYNYLLLILVSIVVSSLIYLGKRSQETRDAPIYWLTVALGFILQGLAGSDPTWASLSIFGSIPTFIAIASMSGHLCGRGVPLRWTALVAGVSLAAWGLAYTLSSSFWVYTLPAAFGVGGLFLYNGWISFDRRATVSAKMFSVAVMVSGLHILDYPFLRIHAGMEALGFSVAYLNGFMMAILIPLITIEKLRMHYTEQLESDVSIATAELRKSNNDLLRAQQEIKNLVHILCHDMANNVTVARFGFDLLIDSVQPAIDAIDTPELELKRSVLAVRTALESQHNLIINVRHLQSVSDGKLKLKLGSVELSSAIAEAELLFDHRLQSKNIRIVKTLEPGLWVRADRSSFINCIFNNLLSNAIKFSPRNSQIEIRVGAGERHVTLEVIDRGAGISPERLALIFSDSVVTSTKGTQGEAGTGFGMPIVKTMVEKCGGRFEIESKTNKDVGAIPGTTMRIVMVRAYEESYVEKDDELLPQAS